jgi:hypothetical protein
LEYLLDSPYAYSFPAPNTWSAEPHYRSKSLEFWLRRKISTCDSARFLQNDLESIVCAKESPDRRTILNVILELITSHASEPIELDQSYIEGSILKNGDITLYNELLNHDKIVISDEHQAEIAKQFEHRGYTQV